MPRPIELSSDLLYSMKFDFEMLTSLNNVSVKLLEYNKRPGFLKKNTLTRSEVEVLDKSHKFIRRYINDYMKAQIRDENGESLYFWVDNQPIAEYEQLPEGYRKVRLYLTLSTCSLGTLATTR